MAIFATENPLVFTFGILGNIISFIVFLAPVPTFVRVWKKKSTEGFQSLPYIVSLFSSMIWLYYASLKPDAFLLITINSIGCVIESIYIALFLIYAPKQPRMVTLRILVLLNLAGFCLILLLSHFFTSGHNRVQVLGWMCVAFSVTVFAAPLSIMRLVIRTKSVEFMPFYLSFFLTLSAIMWLFYGVFLKDIYVALPNIVGFMFGVLQMVLYVVYKNMKAAPVNSEPAAADTKELQHQSSINIDKLIIAANHDNNDNHNHNHNNNDNHNHNHNNNNVVLAAAAATCPLPARDHDDVVVVVYGSEKHDDDDDEEDVSNHHVEVVGVEHAAAGMVDDVARGYGSQLQVQVIKCEA